MALFFMFSKQLGQNDNSIHLFDTVPWFMALRWIIKSMSIRSLLLFLKAKMASFTNKERFSETRSTSQPLPLLTVYGASQVKKLMWQHGHAAGGVLSYKKGLRDSCLKPYQTITFSVNFSVPEWASRIKINWPYHFTKAAHIAHLNKYGAIRVASQESHEYFHTYYDILKKYDDVYCI